MMHEEFGPETHELTTAIVEGIWRDYLRPAELRAQEGSSSMHHPDLAGPTAAGGSNEASHPTYGQQYLVTRPHPDNIHRASSSNVHSAVAEGQASRHEQPEADHSGANSSHEALQAENGVRRLYPPLTNETLPSDRLHGLLSFGRNADRPDFHTMPAPAGMDQGLPPSRSGPSAPSIPAPSYVSAGFDGLAHEQPPQRALRLGELIPQDGVLDRRGRHDLLGWYRRGFSVGVTRRSRRRERRDSHFYGLPTLRPR